MNGWVKIHRKIIEWEWHNSPATLSLFIHLLLLANHDDKEWHGVEVKRGQLVTGRKKLAECTGLSEQQIRTSLNRLKSTKEITISTTKKYSIVTICNYETYQLEQNPTKPINQPSEEPQNNQELTTTGEDKNINKEKGISKDIPKKKENPPIEKPVSEIDEMPVTPDELAERWNAGRGKCPKVLGLSDKRKAKAKLRIAEFGKTRGEQLATIEAIMRGIRESDFLQGEGGSNRKWTCNFEWLITNSDNWRKVVEGNYGNAKPRTRMDKFQEDINYIHDFFNPQDDREDSTPEEQ